MVILSMSCTAHVLHDLDDLVVRLAQSDHQPGLGRYPGYPCLEPGEQGKGMLVVGTRAHFLVEPRYGLEVVIHHIRRRRLENFQSPLHPAAKVGYQHLDPGFRAQFARLADAIDEMGGAAVSQIVPVDRGDDHVVQTKRCNRARKVRRLVPVERIGTAMTDVAERTATRALVAHDHEGRGALAEALADVRAGCFFADGMQLVLPQDPLDLVEPAGRGGNPGPYPVRLSQDLIDGYDLDRYAGGLAVAALLDSRIIGGGSRSVGAFETGWPRGQHGSGISRFDVFHPSIIPQLQQRD